MGYLGSYSLCESGFDSTRFGGGLPAPEGCRLADVLSLLMHVPDKSKLGLFDISRSKLAEIVSVCAGTQVEVHATEELSSSIRVGLKNESIEISQDAAGGLRDAIFAAVLIRVYRDVCGPALSFEELVEEARLVILDELPHAMGYSGSSELDCTMLESHSVILKTQYQRGSCALPLPLQEKVLEHRAVHLRAA